MRPRGVLTIAVVLLSSLVLVACSGGSEPEPADGETRVTDRMSEESKQRTRSCKVSAELTGPEAVGLLGKGRAVVGGDSGPDAFYTFVSDGVELTAYSSGEDFTQSVTVTVGDTTYSTLAESAGLEIARDGKEAQIDADASGVEPDAAPLRVVADFDCR